MLGMIRPASISIDASNKLPVMLSWTQVSPG
jgi:hypothetical protein